MIHTILVATDASPSSNKAIDTAADLAAKYGASLRLLHVIRQMQLPVELRNMAEVEKLVGSRAEVMSFVASKILADAEARAKSFGVTDVHTESIEGEPATTIIDHANQHGVDLIVMGTRGLGTVKSMMLGSVSRKVSNLSGINCLIVRH
jgi:nucleotide-binding universal stress UspA family protein